MENHVQKLLYDGNQTQTQRTSRSCVMWLVVFVAFGAAWFIICHTAEI